MNQKRIDPTQLSLAGNRLSDFGWGPSVNDPKATVATLKAYLGRDPRHAPTLNALGNLYLAAKDFDTAVDYHRRAVRAAPANPTLLNDLANSLILAGLPQDAIEHLDTALALAPSLLPAMLNLARCYRNLNRPDEALLMLNKAETFSGGPNTTTEFERATILSQLGRSEETHTLLRAVLQVKPTDVRAIAELALVSRATPEDNFLEAIRKALSVPSLSRTERSVLHQAAGKVLEDIGQFDDAFEEHKRANQIAASTFDLKSHADFIRMSKLTFSSEFFAARSGFGVATERPIFVVGMPRSGTTLVEQVLARHPKIVGLGEVRNVERDLTALAAKPFGSQAFFDSVSRISKSVCRDTANTYLDSMTRRAGSTLRFVDKMPHNFLLLGWIALLFPKAAIVHCVRDPMDVCVSCYTHAFSSRHGYSNDLSLLGQYYLAYSDLMQHWDSVLPIPIHTLRYEDLIAKPEANVRNLLAYLGTDWDDDCLNLEKSNRIVQTPSRWQVRQPIYSSSIGRWRRFEKHLGPLVETLGQVASNR